MSANTAILSAQTSALPIDFSAPVRRILIVVPDSLEQFLFLLPTLRALREGFEGAFLCAVVCQKFFAVLNGSALVDEVLVSPENNLPAQASLIAKLHGHHFDIGLACSVSSGSTLLVWSSGAAVRVGFEGTTMSALLTHRVAREEGESLSIEAFLDLARALGCAPRVFDYGELLQPSPEAVSKARTILETSGITEPFLIVSTETDSSSSGESGSPRAVEEALWELGTRWPLLLVGEKTHGPLVKVFGRGSARKPICDLGGQDTDTEVLAALCSQACLFLGRAGAYSHLAAAMNKSVVALCSEEKFREREEPRGVTYRLLKNDATTEEIIGAVREMIGV